MPLFFHLLSNDLFQEDFLKKKMCGSYLLLVTYNYFFVNSIWQKVGHERLFDVDQNLLRRALKTSFSPPPVFFTLSLYIKLPRNFLQQLHIPFLLLSHVLYSPVIDWLIFKGEQVWLVSLNIIWHTPKYF